MLTTLLIAGFLYCLLCAAITVAAAVIRVVGVTVTFPARVARRYCQERQKAGAKSLHSPAYFTGRRCCRRKWK
jgi:hypothetical protein